MDCSREPKQKFCLRQTECLIWLKLSLELILYLLIM